MRIRTCAVEIGDVATTAFDLSEEQKRSLRSWVEAQRTEFLETYDPDKYVNRYRRKLVPSAQAGSIDEHLCRGFA